MQPLQAVRDERWGWHLGLDAEATGLLDEFYAGAELGEERLARFLSLFRLEFRDPCSSEAVRGRPVYMGMARPDRELRLKPQYCWSICRLPRRPEPERRSLMTRTCST